MPIEEGALVADSSETLVSIAYQRLRQDLIAGVFLFGGQLKIRHLNERYNIGSAPLREALNRVAQEGLVNYSDQRGFVVAPLTEADLDDLLRTRVLLNDFALRDAIALGDLAWEEALVLAHHRLRRLPFDPRAASAEWEAAHRLFHGALLAACSSPRIKAMCEGLFDSATRYRSLSRVSVVRHGRVEQHQAIMEAALARDADLATRLLREHFTDTATHCRMELRRQAGQPVPDVGGVNA